MRAMAALRSPGLLRLFAWMVLHHPLVLNDIDSAGSRALVLALAELHLVRSGSGLPEYPWGPPPHRWISSRIPLRIRSVWLLLSYEARSISV